MIVEENENIENVENEIDREKVIEKALKIRELANRGVGGEKDAAIKKFKEYCEKHGLNESDLTSFSPIQNDWYTNATPEERGGNFGKWFKRSVAVYKGKPIVFYHKSRSHEAFNEFKHDAGVKMYNGDYGFCFADKDDAHYVRHIGHYYIGGNIIEFNVYLKMTNPYYLYARRDGNSYGQDGEPHRPIQVTKALADSILERGYDSVIIQSDSGINTYIVFKSNQIKSVTNNGDYSDKDDIFC